MIKSPQISNDAGATFYCTRFLGPEQKGSIHAPMSRSAKVISFGVSALEASDRGHLSAFKVPRRRDSGRNKYVKIMQINGGQCPE
jgi:hypothetical protein